jgi:hypothetical protein
MKTKLPIILAAIFAILTHSLIAAPTKNGPNGGKILRGVTPHVEFLVTKDRKVELRFIDADHQVVAPREQQINMIIGERSAPTKIAFVKERDKLVSDKALPMGDDLPTVIQIHEKSGEPPVNIKFALNLQKCPSCINQEYNCTCNP